MSLGDENLVEQKEVDYLVVQYTEPYYTGRG